ncbi:hypothetical protein, partial [Streptosporangium amethystogenes]|uniref:hypothetical protein n=1 Tax=Streptosporangium amethystogenes TaxID=2002 RepID=UPI001B808AD6
AWQCTDPNECHIVYANSATALWDLMQQTELDLQRATPPGTASRSDPEPVPLALPPGHTEPSPSPPEGSQP